MKRKLKIITLITSMLIASCGTLTERQALELKAQHINTLISECPTGDRLNQRAVLEYAFAQLQKTGDVNAFQVTALSSCTGLEALQERGYALLVIQETNRYQHSVRAAKQERIRQSGEAMQRAGRVLMEIDRTNSLNRRRF